MCNVAFEFFRGYLKEPFKWSLSREGSYGAAVLSCYPSALTRRDFYSQQCAKKHSFEFWMKMLFQNTDIPRKEAHSEMYSCWNSERDGFSESCVVVSHSRLH